MALSQYFQLNSYVYSPKQRVIHDLTNKARHITLPAIAVNITGIARDPKRVFNKIYGSYHPRSDIVEGHDVTNSSDHLKPPIPINITVSMSILTKYQSDMDQIISNFVPYNNPYIIISWKLPEGLLQQEQEIRSEVLWDGNLSITYPTEISGNQPYRVSADTSFTIKGWLFKDNIDPVGNIFTVTANLTPLLEI